MFRKFVLLLIASLATIVMSPGILTATDDVAVMGVSDAKAVETVIVEPEPVVVKTAVKAPAAGTIDVVPNYTVTNYVGSVSEYLASYQNLSYSGIYKFNKMVYGHNTANLLGTLSARKVGETITVTEGGVARNYRVAAVALYEKTADGNLDGDAGLMTRIANSALGHDMVLFTCAGRALGGGDATHRLAVYVDAI